MANDVIVEGLDEVIETIKKVGELPQKCVNKAAKKGIQIAKKSAKNGRWVDQTGYLRKAIKELSFKPTVFIVSQRAASIMHADKIVVLDDGEVVGIGTHPELLKNCDVYKEIYNSQFKIKEA